MKNTYNAVKQLCLYYMYKRLWQGYSLGSLYREVFSVNLQTEN